MPFRTSSFISTIACSLMLLNGCQLHPEARAEVIIQPFRQAITGDAQIEDVRDYSRNFELHVGDTGKLLLYDVSLELASVDAKRCTVIVVDHRNANSRAVFSAKADDVIQFSTDVTNRLFVNKIGRKAVEFTLFSFPVPRNMKVK